MTTVSQIPGFLTADEAAGQLGVSHSQLTRYVRNGLLPARKIGQVILINQGDLDQFERPPRGNPAFLKSEKD